MNLSLAWTVVQMTVVQMTVVLMTVVQMTVAQTTAVQITVVQVKFQGSFREVSGKYWCYTDSLQIVQDNAHLRSATWTPWLTVVQTTAVQITVVQVKFQGSFKEVSGNYWCYNDSLQIVQDNDHLRSATSR